MTSIAEFGDVFELYEGVEWLFFLASTLLNVIVLLNALIAITGETFSKIYATREQEKYRMKV